MGGDLLTMGHMCGWVLVAVPYAKNPAPSYFAMPDFSKSQGGWGVGKNESNVKFYLVVYEEYDDGSVSRWISLPTSRLS